MIVDVPGHENFKSDVISEAQRANGIIYLIDPRSRQNIYKNALYLYDIFVSKNIQAANKAFLIVANFQDQNGISNAAAVREDLEKEL